MKKFFKWFGIVLGSLIGLIVLVFLGLMLKGNSMLNKKYDAQVETITIPTDAEAIARGEHWANSQMRTGSVRFVMVSVQKEIVC